MARLTGGGAKKAKPNEPVTQPPKMAPKPNQRRQPDDAGTTKTSEGPKGRAITELAAVKAPRNSHAAATTTPTKTRAPSLATSPRTSSRTPGAELVAPPALTTPSPSRKSNVSYSPEEVDARFTLATRPTPPRSPKVMENGRCPHVCCEEFVFCGPNSFDRTRLGDGTDKYPGWRNYPKVCTGCKKDIKPGRKQANDEKNNITRVNANRPLQMCANACNHRDHPCVRSYCHDCGDLLKAFLNPNGSPTKAQDAKGRHVRTSNRKRTAMVHLNPGEKRLRNGDIVPANHARKD